MAFNEIKLDHYKLLGVEKNATKHTIIKAFRQKARLYHPDKNVDNGDCEELMKLLTIAKQVLIDANERAKYDDNYVPNEFETPVGSLANGKRRSDQYIRKINEWMAEYSDIKLISNINLLDKQINEIIGQLKQISNEIPFNKPKYLTKYQTLLNSVENNSFEDKFAKIVPKNTWNMEGVYPNSVFSDQTRVQSFGKWSDFGHSMFDENFRTALFCYQKAKDNEAIYRKAIYLYRTSKKYVSALLYFRCLLDTEKYRITATIYVIKILLKTLDKGLIEFCAQKLLVNVNLFISEEIASTTNYGILDKLFTNILKGDHYFRTNKYVTALYCYSKTNDSKLIHQRMLELYSKKEYSFALAYCLRLYTVPELKPYLIVTITKLLLKEFNRKNFEKLADLVKPSIRVFIPDYVWNMNGVINNDIFNNERLVNCFGDWKATADFYFDDTKYEIALFCYQRANDPKFILEKAEQLCNENRNEHSVLYYRYLLGENRFAAKAALNLLKLSVSLNYTKDVHDLALMAAKVFNNCPEIHEYVSTILSRKQLIVESRDALELSIDLGLTLTKTIVITRNSLNDKCNAIYYSGFKKLVYEQNIGEISRYFEENNCQSIAGLLYEELTKQQDITKLPAKYRAILLFIKGVHEYNDSNFNQSLNSFGEALLAYPHKELITSINKFISKNHIKAGIDQITIALKQTKYSLPKYHNYVESLKSSTLLRTVTKFEKGINNANDLNNFEKAMLYIDLTMACCHPTIIAMNFLISANYLYEEMLESSDATKLYAYRNTICEFVANILFFSQRFMDPIMTTHFIKYSISLLYNSNIYFNSFVVNNDSILKSVLRFRKTLRDVNLIDDFQSNLLAFANNTLTRFIEITPLINLPLTLSADTLFLNLVSSEFCEEYYNNALKCLNNDEKNAYKYDYCLLEGSWKGWANTDKFMEYRENCMKSLMSMNKFKKSQIEKIISWNVINRDIDGWIDWKSTDLRLEGINFDSIEGIVIDINNGTFDLLLSPSEHKPGLFNTSDIVEILSNGISFGIFSLEEPDGRFQCHPFQQMKYGPQSIADTKYLMTLLHADYMLKMITMQTEVCAKWPHVLRDANLGFMNKLPKELRELISMDKSKRNYGQAHRFWIEAKELPYKTTELGINVMEYRFDYCPLVVKTHLLKLNAKSELIDDDNDSDYYTTDDEQENESNEIKTTKKRKLKPEKQFANKFTEFYDEIGSYFPVFLRLRELLKLNAVSLLLKSVFQSLEKTKKNMIIDTERIKSMLNEMRKKLEYPIYSESKVDSVFRDTLHANGVYDEYRVEWSDRDRVKRQIRSNLRDAEQQLFTEIAKCLCQSVECDYSIEMRNNVCVWLENNNNVSLVNYMRNKIIQNQIKKLSKFGDNLKHLGISTSTDEISFGFNQQTCSWIPSAFSSNDSIKVYGGVLLQPNLVATTGGSGSGSGSTGSGGGSGGSGSGNGNNGNDGKRGGHPKGKYAPHYAGQQQNKFNGKLSSNTTCDHVGPHRLIKMNFSSRKDAYEAAKRAGDHNEPVLHYRDAKGNPPHYHPTYATKKGELVKLKDHSHYFFPKGK